MNTSTKSKTPDHSLIETTNGRTDAVEREASWLTASTRGINSRKPQPAISRGPAW
jgi:hypothetical protein